MGFALNQKRSRQRFVASVSPRKGSCAQASHIATKGRGQLLITRKSEKLNQPNEPVRLTRWDYPNTKALRFIASHTLEPMQKVRLLDCHSLLRGAQPPIDTPTSTHTA